MLVTCENGVFWTNDELLDTRAPIICFPDAPSLHSHLFRREESQSTSMDFITAIKTLKSLSFLDTTLESSYKNEKVSQSRPRQNKTEDEITYLRISSMSQDERIWGVNQIEIVPLCVIITVSGFRLLTNLGTVFCTRHICNIRKRSKLSIKYLSCSWTVM